MPAIDADIGNSMVMPRRRFSRWMLLPFALVTSVSLAAPADNTPSVSLSAGYRFSETSGEELFSSVCQGCHMPDGHGAIGAGNYPSLAHDKNLEARGYPVYVVVRGQKAMPPVGAMMSNDQVAAVVNYVRTHFGNAYPDAVTLDDVRQARP
jgi:mono/diheme cytochrome c family protein